MADRRGPSARLLETLDRIPPRFGAAGFDRLAAHGIDIARLNACGTPRPARVRPEGTRFVFDDTGAGMLIQPVADGAQASLISGDSQPELVDLIAYRIDYPDVWYFYRGEPRLVLGADALIEAAATDAPLRIHRTPRDWLAAGGDGCCLLDWTGCRQTLAGVGDLIAADPDHAAWIRRRLAADRSDLPAVTAST